MSTDNTPLAFIFCPRCGRKNLAEALFCMACGREIPRLTDEPGPQVPHGPEPDRQNTATVKSPEALQPVLRESGNQAEISLPARMPSVPDTSTPALADVLSELMPPAYTESSVLSSTEQANTYSEFSADEDLSGDTSLEPAHASPSVEKGPNGRPVCRRCGKEATLLNSVTFNRSTGYCARCAQETREAYMSAYLYWCPNGIISPDALQWLSDYAAELGLDLSKAVGLIRKDAIASLRGMLARARDDASIALSEADYANLPLTLEILGTNFMASNRIKSQANALRPEMQRRVYTAWRIQQIHSGNLPVVQINHIYLESDEVCHLAASAQFLKVRQNSSVWVPGELIATNKKLLFRSNAGGTEIQWKNVLNVQFSNTGISLELSTKSGHGFYAVGEPLIVAALLTVLTRMWKRQVVFAKASSASRHIPQEVRTAVWQRDGGACVQCGDTDYLEFDHIIPHSKGGANTVNNVQLLCRKCNRDKSDRI